MQLHRHPFRTEGRPAPPLPNWCRAWFVSSPVSLTTSSARMAEAILRDLETLARFRGTNVPRLKTESSVFFALGPLLCTPSRVCAWRDLRNALQAHFKTDQPSCVNATSISSGWSGLYGESPRSRVLHVLADLCCPQLSQRRFAVCVLMPSPRQNRDETCESGSRASWAPRFGGGEHLLPFCPS